MKPSGRGSWFSHPFPPTSQQCRTALLLVAALPLWVRPAAVAQGTVSISPASISFGNHYLGSATATQVVTLTNNQTVPLSISSVALTGANPAEFAFGNTCPTNHPLAAGLSCTMNVRYLASTLGTSTAALTVTDNSSDSPQSVALSATGLSPVTISAASLTFGQQIVNTASVGANIILTNQTSSSVSVSSASATAGFAVSTNTCSPSLAAKLKCSIGVTFTPPATGPQSGALSIIGIPGGPVTISLIGTGIAAPQGWANIQHVIIIFQENRTPDNLFQDPVLIANGADIAASGLDSTGATIPLAPMDLGTNGSSPQLYDLGHNNGDFVAMYDHGKMDGADKVVVNCNGSSPCPLPDAAFKYVLPADVAPYFQMAEQYTFGDRMFQTNQGPSLPAHQFIISGTSAPTATSNSFEAGNVISPGSSPTGCISTPDSYVEVINPLGKLASTTYPCFEHQTLTDLLDAAGVSWRYYWSGSIGSLWTAPTAIEHMCVPNAPPPNGTACTGPDWGTKVVQASGVNHPGVLGDIANGNLASVSWVIPSGAASDHAGTDDGSGPSWVASIVNAVGSSGYWQNTAIIVTWDDWGGWYDHVAPKVVDDGVSWGSGYIYGFRVPLLVIAPFARPNYISHVDHDFGSILKMVEQVYNLPSLGYADAYADDLSDCFNFTQAPIQFQTISAPIPADHFRNDNKPQADPDDD
jgi:phospholipase C